jgi:hypothetical protein
MIRKMLIVGTAAVLAAGATSAAFAADRYAAPSQPVPYSQLNAYMKGSASKRAAIVAQAGDQTAQTGTSANTSATTPAAPALPNDTAAAPAPTTAPMPSATPAPTTAPMPNATPGTAGTTNPATPGAVNPTVPTPPTTPSTPAPTPQ